MVINFRGFRRHEHTKFVSYPNSLTLSTKQLHLILTSFQHLIRLIPWLDLVAGRGIQALGYLPMTVRRLRPSRHIYQSISQWEAVYAAS